MTDGGSAQAGGGFDASMRTLMKIDPGAICRLADVKAEDEVVDLPARFPLQAREVDLLLRVGPGRLAHFEYQRRVEPDLVVRMLGYRYLIMDRYPADELTQYVIVLGAGTIRGHDDFPGQHFALDLQVVYVRDLDPAVLLAEPVLAPLASLARGTPAEREQAFAAALKVIEVSGPAGADRLREAATRLATITLDSTTIGRIMSESQVDEEAEAKVREVYSLLPPVQRLMAENAAEKVGEKAEHLMLVLLRARFGDATDLPALAARLATWTDEAAVDAITSASDLAALRKNVVA